MKYSLCDSSWDNKEIEAINEVVKTNMFTMGKYVKQYEEDFAKKFGAKHAVMVNSGSSANLVAIAALVYSKRLNPGDEVIVPAVSWSTTYFPLAQMGLKLVFVDIDPDTLNIDTDKIEAAISPKTKMIMLVNLLGNPNEFDKINEICKNHGLFFIEDNCESMGARYKKQELGSIGLLGTFSTFFAHHMCTMEGGVIITDDDVLYDYMLCIRAHGWTRNLSHESSIYEKNEDEFYEKFNFIVPGFNVRPIEIEASIGIEQLKKLDEAIRLRRENAEYLKSKLNGIKNIRMQKEVEESSWYAFAIIFENELSTNRNAIAKKLDEAGIENRPVVAGNFTKNKAIEYLDYRISGELTNSNEIHNCGLYIGNHPKDIKDKIDYFIEVIKEITEGEKI